MTLGRNILYYGSDNALPERVRLHAGPLTLEYENGDLRYIRLGEQEIIRRIYVAIRDPDWGTALPQQSPVKIEADNNSFHITYDVDTTSWVTSISFGGEKSRGRRTVRSAFQSLPTA